MADPCVCRTPGCCKFAGGCLFPNTTPPVERALTTAIRAAEAEAAAYGLDRAGIDVCVHTAIAAFLEASGNITDAAAVRSATI
jgi:hypothetical protein